MINQAAESSEKHKAVCHHAVQTLCLHGVGHDDRTTTLPIGSLR